MALGHCLSFKIGNQKQRLKPSKPASENTRFICLQEKLSQQHEERDVRKPRFGKNMAGFSSLLFDHLMCGESGLVQCSHPCSKFCQA